MPKKPALSIVVIAKNEEENIGYCLNSVVAEAKNFDSVEIILVDSRSSDRTVEIASKYDIKIAVMGKEHRVNPGLGRFIGSQLASGDFVFFIDGDTALCDGWLKEAMALVGRFDWIAGVTGNMEEGTIGKNGEFHQLRTLNSFSEPRYKDAIAVTTTMSGTTLFRKDILKKAGNFDPFMITHEDTELLYRIQKKGYEVAWLPKTMGHHLTDTYSLKENITRFKTGYYVGAGQLLNRSIKGGFLRKGYKFMKHIINCFLVLFLGLVCCFISMYIKNLNFFFIWLAPVILMLVINLIKAKNIKVFVINMVRIFWLVLSFWAGIFLFPRPYDDKSWHYKIVK